MLVNEIREQWIKHWSNVTIDLIDLINVTYCHTITTVLWK